MCDPVSATIAAVAIGAGGQIISSENQKSAMKDQMAQNKRMAEQQAREAKTIQDSTAQKARRPKLDPAAALYGQASPGIGSTSITGTQGIDTSQLTLGKSSLLGS